MNSPLREIVVKFAGRCARCDHPYPITPGSLAAYDVETRKLIHFACLTRDENASIPYRRRNSR